MKPQKTNRLIVTCALAAMCAVWLAGAGLAVESATLMPKRTVMLDIKPGNLKGTIFNVQGKPMASLEITARNALGAVVSKAVTAKDGGYTLLGLKAGKYSLYIGDRKSGTLNVTANSRISRLKAVIPVRGPTLNPGVSGGGAFNSTTKSGKSGFTAIKTSMGYIIITNWNAQRHGAVGPTGPKVPPNVSP